MIVYYNFACAHEKLETIYALYKEKWIDQCNKIVLIFFNSVITMYLILLGIRNKVSIRNGHRKMCHLREMTEK